MRPVFALLLILVLSVPAGTATAQERLHFTSLDAKDDAAPPIPGRRQGYLDAGRTVTGAGRQCIERRMPVATPRTTAWRHSS
jgi:hypothetical protein